MIACPVVKAEAREARYTAAPAISSGSPMRRIAVCAVTAIADEQRGERVVALYAGCDLSPVELWQRLSETALPKLWIPKCENLYPVTEIPLLGTGKLDLGALKLRAQELAAVKT